MYKKGIQIFVVLCFISLVMMGCHRNKESGKEKKDEIDFTVCQEENLPKELKELIEKEKEKPFHFSYTTKEYSYIAVGYGQQNMGGYSIQVTSLYETEYQVVIETSLKGPEASEKKQGASYPYIVVKIQNREKAVSFR